MILIDGKTVKESDLLKRFNLTFKNSAEFERIGLKPDHLNGGLKGGRGTRLQPAFIIKWEDSEAELRLTSKINRKKNKKGEIEESYATSRFVFDGPTKKVSKLDEFIFLALNPKNEDSPFFKKDSLGHFRLKDNAKAAKMQLELAGWEDKVRAIINGLSGSDLRIKAAGISKDEYLSKAGARHVSQNMSDAEIKAMLIQVARTHPKHLFEHLEASINVLKGTIDEAVTLGIVRLVNGDTKKLWMLGENRIATVDYDDPDPILVLRDVAAQTVQEKDGIFNKIRLALFDKYLELNIKSVKTPEANKEDAAGDNQTEKTPASKAAKK